MTVVGCTGHQALSDATKDVLLQEIIAHLLRFSNDGELEGVCSLATGTDQIFATALMGVGGRLSVIVPSRGYASTFTTDEDRGRYAEFLACAVTIEELEYSSPSEEAFMAAGRAVTDRSDVLLAVWDGRPAAGLGGTADVIEYARERGKPVDIVWPRGAHRS